MPHALVGQALEARIARNAVELLHRDQRIADHARSSSVGGFSTEAGHMPWAHPAHMEWTPQRLIDFSRAIGPAVAT